MRVLIINSMFYTSAYRRCADELGVQPEIDLTVLTVDGWIMNDRLSNTEALSGNVPYSFIIGKTLWKGKENRGFYISGLRRAFHLSQPEIIFLMEEPFSLFALQVLFLKNLYSPNSKIVFFTWNNLSFSEFDYRPSVWYRMVSRWTLDRCDGALTANSDGITVLGNTGFAKPIEKIGYGVRTDRFIEQDNDRVEKLRAEIGITPEQVIIGYVGRLLRMKGLDILLDAFASLDNPNLRLLIVGSGEFEQELMVLAERLGISDRIIHYPSVAHGDVPAYMQLINIFVLPSRRYRMWAEQFGRVLVEAMAAGAIVIGSDSGAIPEVIGNAGFVFRENDVDSLREALNNALALDSNARSQLLSIGRERASKEHSWERFATQAAAFLKRIRLSS